MKKISNLILSFILMMGVSGCMNTIGDIKSNNYEAEILHYLEEKYDEKFVIEEMVRQTDVGTPSVIMAKMYCQKYPNEYFDVIYHLSTSDIDRKKEVIEFLKKINAYDENKLKPVISDDGGYFEDNYCNIVLQNEFDKKYALTNVTYVKTIFETTNFYPSIDGSEITINEYIESLPCSLYACTMVFVEEKEAIEKDILIKQIAEELLVKEMDRQFIYIHFTGKNSEFIEQEFKENYSNAVMYFKDAEYVTEYENIFIRKGEIQSN